jgi:hypothetical protein
MARWSEVKFRSSMGADQAHSMVRGAARGVRANPRIRREHCQSAAAWRSPGTRAVSKRSPERASHRGE